MKKLTTILATFTAMLCLFCTAAACANTHVIGSYETTYCSFDTDDATCDLKLELKKDNSVDGIITYKNGFQAEAEAVGGEWFESNSYNGTTYIRLFLEFSKSSDKRNTTIEIYNTGSAYLKLNDVEFVLKKA